MTRIVVPLDGSLLSERAIETAREYAERLEADVLLVRVVNEDRPNQDQAAARQQSEAYLQARRQDALPSAEVRTVDAPTVVQGLLNLISDEGADLLIMSAHGRTGSREQPMGSVTRDLLHTSPVPIMVLGVAA